MNYTAIANKVVNKLKQYGTACQIKRVSGEVYNPETNEYENTETVVNGNGIAGNYALEAVDGTNVKIEDVNIMCMFDSAPVVNDKLTFGSKEYSIISIKEVNPSGNKVLYYEAQCR